MKKIVRITAIFLLVFIMTSCGAKKNEETEYAVRKKTEQQDVHEIRKSSITDADNYEEGGVSVSVTDISYEDVTTKINFEIKNESDGPLRIMTANFSVNGLMTTDSMLLEIPAKSCKDGFVEISNEWFYKMGIEVIKDIELVVKVFDSENHEIMQSNVMHIKTDAPWSYVQKFDDSGVVLYNENGVKLSVRTLHKSEYSNDYELVFYAENNTDSAISITSDVVSVNEKSLKPLFVMSLGANKKAVDTMVFYEEDLKLNEIDKISYVTAKFKAFNEQLEVIFETDILNVPVS